MSRDASSQVITFYSYKGGTGRTMALANIGCLLAQKLSGERNQARGKGVLMVDWDLEAPGLHQFFRGKLERQLSLTGDRDQALDRYPGLIDLFEKLDTETRGRDRWKEETAEELFDSVNLGQFILGTDIPSLDLLKAGRFDEKYPSRVNTFQWEALYSRVPWLVLSFAERLAKQYQYVLIDSRTGLTDIGGICTMLMPDKIVAVFTPNRQSLIGLLELVRRATDYRRQSDDLRPLAVFPLPSRIEATAERDLRVDWRYGNPEKDRIGYQPRFEELFKEVYDLPKCDLGAYFDEVQIQHVPAYAYGEEIAVLVERSKDRLSSFQSYKRFSELLVNLAGPWEDLGKVLEPGAVAEMHGGTVITAGRDVTYTAVAGGEDPDALRRRYLEQVAAEANRLPWASLDPDYADPSRGESLGLADVYTALDTTQLEWAESGDELRAFLAHQAKARRIPAQEIINRESRLLLLGDPGSGKSTLVNYLSYVLAQAGRAEEPGPWLKRLTPWDHGPLLPLRVILREFAAGLPEGIRHGKAALLLQHLRATLDEWGLDSYWPYLRQALGEGEQPFLVLLDGLDEVPTELRQAVVESVDEFAMRYPRQRYLVTCRPYAYVGQPWRLSGFREVTLVPFSEEQMDHFITAWYDELARRGHFTKAEAETRARRLKAAANRADLRWLAERPLLLTVMALLHTFRGQLPEDRVELYRWTVDLLLRRWEGRVGGEQGILEVLALPGLKMSDLEAGLYEVAFRAHQDQEEAEGTADVAEKDLRDWLAPYLGGSWDRAGRFVDYIRERAGLLVRHKPEAYTFPHRTFQEFLAACHLTGHPDFPAEAARLIWEDLDHWRAVYILAASHAARTHRLGSALSAINALCPKPYAPGEDVSNDVWETAVLAGETLLEIGLVGVRREPMGQALLERTKGWLAALLEAGALDPRERAGAGDVLARLGDPRPPGVGLREDGLPDIAWCGVPEGSFLMGGDKARDSQAYDDELPQHEVTLPAYSISKYPVTNAQYAAFVQDGGYTEKWRRCWTGASWEWKGDRTGPETRGDVFDLPNHPVVGVTWYEAVAFCRWLTERLREAGDIEPDQEVTLPTEAQWEKAARGGDGRIFPWGDEFDPAKCNVVETGIGTTSAVGMFPAGVSPYGVLDMSGNVWEWSSSLYQDYPYDPEDGREDLEAEGSRVLRGGSWAYDNVRYARCSYRLVTPPSHFLDGPGFRLVVGFTHSLSRS